jgi:hypothetical protein
VDESTLQRLVAESEIRRTMARIFLAVDGRRFREYSEQYTEDARHGDRIGREAIFESISRGALAKNPTLRRKHMSPNIVIDIDGDEASAVSDLVMLSQFSDDSYSVRLGEYRDQLRRVDDGRWLFAERRLTIQPESEADSRRITR